MPQVGKTEEEYYQSIYKKNVEIIHTDFSVRNIYKVKKGDIIKLVKESKSGDVFKVQLLMKQPGRDYYFVESETLKHYKLIEPLSSSN